MANYTTANLVKAQLALSGAMAKADTRFREPAVWKLFLRNSENFFPNYQALRTREDRVLEANYFKRSQRALGAARAANHTGSRGDSGVLVPSFATKTDKFSMSLKQANISIFTAQEELDNEFMNSIANFMEGLDATASAALTAARTGVNPATAEGTFDAANDVFEITESTNGNRAIQIAKTVMNINKYKGRLTFVCDSIAFNRFQYLAAQGAQNSTNYSFQYVGIDFIHDPALTAAALVIDVTYTKGFFQVIPENMIGALTHIPKQNREGRTTSVNMYSAINNPFDGLQYALHTYETRADDGANNGYTQDVVTQFEVSLDVALEVAPLSTATESPIFAFALV